MNQDHFLAQIFLLNNCPYVIPSAMSEERLQKLEETIAHQDQQIADLSEMLILQGREIAKLHKEITKLNAKLHVMENHGGHGEGEPLSGAEFAAQNKPPHY